MKQKKTKILVGVLLALVMFASSVALLMYSKQNKLSKYVESHVEVYIAAKQMHEGDIIGANDIKISRLPKSYIGFTPLTKAEIVGRYAKVDIYKTEPMRPEKITFTKPSKEVVASAIKRKEAAVESVKLLSSDTIAVSLSVFRNLDSSLKKGDFIDIVSVKPKSMKRNKNTLPEFTTKYIALHVAIDSFISNSKPVDKLLVEKYDKKNNQVGFDMATTVVFQMKPNDIKNFLPMYYMTLNMNGNRLYATKGSNGHLWMVKNSEELDEKLQREKERLLVDAKRVTAKRYPKQNRVTISYEK